MSKLTVFFVPGLQGDKGLDAESVFAPRSNLAAVQAAALILRADFKVAAYQTPENKFPTLDEMGEAVRLQLDDTARSGSRILVVASSTGFGAVFPSLRHGDHAIGLLPVPSPIEIIELQVQLTAPRALPLLEKVKNGQGTFSLPISKTEDGPEQGVFILEPKHFQGLRILSDEASRLEIDRRLDGRPILSLHLMTAENDPLARPVEAFQKIAQDRNWVRDLTKQTLLGGHGDTRYEEVKSSVLGRVQVLGFAA